MTENFGNGGGGVGGLENGAPTFWTVCPYCYYAYEYEKMYMESCVRCQNENCTRGFTATAIHAPPPPEGVLQSGKYLCFGFWPVAIGGGSTNGHAVGDTDGNWTPFAGKQSGRDAEVQKCHEEAFIEISDDENEDVGEDANANGKKAKVRIYNDVELGNTSKNGDSKFDRRKIDSGVHSGSSGGVGIGGIGVGMRRRFKMAARSTKKVSGRGIRIDRSEMNFTLEEDEDCDDDDGMGSHMEKKHSDERVNVKVMKSCEIGNKGKVEFF